MSAFSKIFGGLKKTRENLAGKMSGLFSAFTKIDEDLFEELEEILVTSDVGVHTAEKICRRLREEVKKQGIKDPSAIKGLLTDIVCELLTGDASLSLNPSPAVILVIGVNGVGKTTTIGKLASQLKAEGKSVILGGADTFRAAAVEQLAIWADRAGVPLVKHGEGADPAAVVFDTISAAKARRKDVVIIDTAGRLHNKKNLMDELSKIRRIIARENPDGSFECLLVLDGATGQNAVNQAREFSKVTELTGIVLTKLDGTARGGALLSIREELQIPVKFVGLGEGIDDLQPFAPEDFARAMLEG